MTSSARQSLSNPLRLSSEDPPTGISFAECVSAALNNPEFVANWLRLRGFRLPASEIQRRIDSSTRYSDTVALTFLNDVLDLLYSRLPEGVRR